MYQKVNDKYKDRLFLLVFHDKKDLLDLYNAVAHRDYQDPEELEITTLEDAIYMGFRNDVSFIVSNALNLYEQQSSFNPNMPLRGLSYFSELYQKFVEVNRLNIYGTRLLELPVPQYVVFYNGTREEPDRLELRLSDAFAGSDREPCLECKAMMLNINYGHNKELMERSSRLSDYSLFVFRVRENAKQGMVLVEAVDQAVKSCIRDGVLADVLSKHRAEVCNLILYEYDEQKQIAIERNEAKEEGKAEGKAEAVLELLEDLGSIPEELYTKITGESDLTVLARWLKSAAKAESVEEFIEKM